MTVRGKTLLSFSTPDPGPNINIHLLIQSRLELTPRRTWCAHHPSTHGPWHDRPHGFPPSFDYCLRALDVQRAFSPNGSVQLIDNDDWVYLFFYVL